eukprot:339223_1
MATMFDTIPILKFLQQTHTGDGYHTLRHAIASMVSAKDTFSVSHEFYRFLVVLFAFNFFVWCTLQHEDELLSPLSYTSIQNMSTAAFKNTLSRLSPHFIKFELNCKNNYLPFTLNTWHFLSCVLRMDWLFRLPYLYALYRVALYLETKYQFKMKKLVLNRFITVANQQTMQYKVMRRVSVFAF